MKNFILPFISALILSFSAQGQLAADSTKADWSLQGQYQTMLAKSRTVNGYKLINPIRITNFWKSLNDTLTRERRQLADARKKNEELQKTIAQLKAEISGKETSLASSKSKVDEITFMGISFAKSTYSTVVWTLITVLAVALVFVVIRSAKHIHEAKYRSTLYEEIAQEYQSYKTKANDKEKKLARELQDERNKLEELRSRGI